MNYNKKNILQQKDLLKNDKSKNSRKSKNSDFHMGIEPINFRTPAGCSTTEPLELI